MPDQPEHRLTEQEKLLANLEQVRRLLEAALALLPDPDEVRSLAAVGQHTKIFGPVTDKEAFGR